MIGNSLSRRALLSGGVATLGAASYGSPVRQMRRQIRLVLRPLNESRGGAHRYSRIQ